MPKENFKVPKTKQKSKKDQITLMTYNEKF